MLKNCSDYDEHDIVPILQVLTDYGTVKSEIRLS